MQAKSKTEVRTRYNNNEGKKAKMYSMHLIYTHPPAIAKNFISIHWIPNPRILMVMIINIWLKSKLVDNNDIIDARLKSKLTDNNNITDVRPYHI